VRFMHPGRLLLERIQIKGRSELSPTDRFAPATSK
jgi:hypothetical protein